MTRTIRESYPDIHVGGTVALQFRERQVSVRVVGLVEEIGMPAFYADFDTFDAVTGMGDASTVLRAKGGGGHPELVASARARSASCGRWARHRGRSPQSCWPKEPQSQARA